MEILLQDIRFALRMLARSAGVTVPAVLALALGIGANAAIFSVVSAILLRPLPYREPERLVTVYDNFFKMDLVDIWTSVPEYQDLQQRSTTLEGFGAYADLSDANLTGLSRPERVQVGVVTASLFPLLGVSPERGRAFLPEEDDAGKSQVVVVSHRFWKTRLGGEHTAVGRTVVLDGTPCTVVGVMPASFDFPARADLWTPFGFTPAQKAETTRGRRYLRVLARMKPGVTLEQVRADVERVAEELRKNTHYNPTAGWAFTVRTLSEHTVGHVRLAMLVLLGAVGFVLLIACGNVANLLLARAAARQREMAVRAALGAGRTRLIAQLLTESLLLSLLGGGAGLLLATWGVDALLAAAPDTLPRAAEIQVDLGVVAATFGLAVVTGLLFGLVPALHASRPDMHQAMAEGARDTGAKAGRARAALVVTQVALALVLLLGAGLMLKSFRELSRISPGFEPQGALVGTVSLPQPKYADNLKAGAFWAELSQRAAALPGVKAAGAISILPLTGRGDRSFEIEGYTPPPGVPGPDEEIRIVTPDYFRALGQPLVAGRALSDSDGADAPATVVVNQAFAKRYFKDGSAMGRRIRPHGSVRTGVAWPWTTIVGVVSDAREWGLELEARPAMYYPARQVVPNRMTLVVRTEGEPASAAAGLRRELSALDPELPLFDVGTLEDVVDRSVGQRRFSTQLLALFAAVALCLSAVGIYGLVSYSVTQRTRELGIRMALGANAGQVVRLVLGQASRLALSGVAIGVVAGLLLTRLLSSLLYGVGAADPTTLFGVAALLAAVALLASAVPAWRATRVQPVVALRSE